MRTDIRESSYRSLSATDTQMRPAVEAGWKSPRSSIHIYNRLERCEGTEKRHAYRKTLLGRTKDPSRREDLRDPLEGRASRKRILCAALDREREKGKRAISITFIRSILFRLIVPVCRYTFLLRTKHDTRLLRKWLAAPPPRVSFSLHLSLFFRALRTTAAWWWTKLAPCTTRKYRIRRLGQMTLRPQCDEQFCHVSAALITFNGPFWRVTPREYVTHALVLARFESHAFEFLPWQTRKMHVCQF